MNYLVDSDWVTDWLAGKPDAVQTLSRLAPEGLTISLITYGEIFEAFIIGETRAERGRSFTLSAWCLGSASEQAYHAASCPGARRVVAQIISAPDILIAATALYHDLTLISRHHAHFARVPDLKPYRDI